MTRTDEVNAIQMLAANIASNDQSAGQATAEELVEYALSEDGQAGNEIKIELDEHDTNLLIQFVREAL